jgi:hypothetical protein
MKKILLNESEKKALIFEREKAIIANFAKTFNAIKRVDENDGEDYEAASRGVEYGIDPYQEQPDMDEPQFDFVTSAIESASGDKVERRGVDDYGRDIYFSLNNNNVTYFIGDNEDDIILYNGETGERYPIGKLKHYDEPRRAKDDPNNIYF